MASKYTVMLVTLFVIGLLAFNLVLCGLLSYWGTGVQAMGAGGLRTGSVSGPTVGGGGPGEGK